MLFVIINAFEGDPSMPVGDKLDTEIGVNNFKIVQIIKDSILMLTIVTFAGWTDCHEYYMSFEHIHRLIIIQNKLQCNWFAFHRFGNLNQSTQLDIFQSTFSILKLHHFNSSSNDRIVEKKVEIVENHETRKYF